jgi:hypothetical protein
VVRVRRAFVAEEAWMLGWVLGVDWDNSAFDVDEFRRGLDRELELGRTEEDEDGTHLDTIRIAKVALANLRERPDHYSDHPARAEARPA